ncbi:hypothetical protein ACPA54_12880 [Uniformispora flossi]|uniref:hypothetical protein n=1 Tax=Uniformispora flossi TaxID=3390723 RepID=UPI003C2E4F3F
MATSYEPYEAIMTRLRAEMPSLADQLDQEVRHGRAVSEQGLRQEGRYEERASRLAATELPPLGKTDVAVIPYTDDERIELVREALLTLAETMYATRNAALQTARAHGLEPEIQFGDPELEVPTRISLSDETPLARVALQKVRELLANGHDVHPEVEG